METRLQGGAYELARKKARRRLRVKDGLFAGLGLLGVALILSISGIIGALCWPYAINTWLVYAHKAPAILWYHGFLFGYVPFMGQLSIPVAVVTFVLMLFLV